MLNGRNNKEKVQNCLEGAGLDDYGTVGLMGDLYAGGGLRPDDLQNTYKKELGMTDASYMTAVDGGAYTGFVRDCVGYGLVQWTRWNRKQGFFDSSRAAGRSIEDLEMQLDFLMGELHEGCKAVLTTLKTVGSVRQASDIVLLQFECPAGQSETAKKRRTLFGQKYYGRYTKPEEGQTVGTFEPKLAQPEVGNKYCITKASGGWSDTIEGKPADMLCNTPSNCVGYVYGRLNEIGGYGCCKYLRPVSAENFIQSVGGLAVGREPKLGACMV